MGSNKEAQAARNAADRRLRQEYPGVFEAFMREEHEARGLTWNRRPSKEERAERALQEARAKSRARIEAEAEKAGIKVTFLDGVEVVDLTEDEDISATQYDVNNPDVVVEKPWADMSEAEREAVAGTRAPRSDAEEALAWGETDVDYRH